MSTITDSIDHATGTGPGVIVFVVLAVVAALGLLVAVLILLRPPAIDADRAQEQWDITRRAAGLKWQQD